MSKIKAKKDGKTAVFSIGVWENMGNEKEGWVIVGEGDRTPTNPVNAINKEASKAYESGDFYKARELYKKAQAIKPVKKYQGVIDELDDKFKRFDNIVSEISENDDADLDLLISEASKIDEEATIKVIMPMLNNK